MYKINKWKYWSDKKMRKSNSQSDLRIKELNGNTEDEKGKISPGRTGTESASDEVNTGIYFYICYILSYSDIIQYFLSSNDTKYVFIVCTYIIGEYGITMKKPQ